MKGKCWALMLSAVVSSGAQSTYDETRIRSWVYQLGPWDMVSSAGYANYIWVPASTVPFGTDRIVGSKTMIYSDPSSSACPSCATEVHNFTRQSGYNNFNSSKPRYKSGGWTEFFRFTPGSGATQDLLISLDWPCNTFNPGGACIDKFFGTPSFNYDATRKFSGATSNRGLLKVDYVCPGACPSSNVKELWIKMPTWNMWSRAHQYFPLSNYGISSSSIVDMAATVYSDPGVYAPNTSTTIQVDDFEHIGPRSGHAYGVRPYRRGRGGIMWVGKGCGGGPWGAECSPGYASTPAIHLYAGAGGNQASPGYGSDDPKSSYRQTPFVWDANSNQNPIAYNSPTNPRGWIKIEYTGTTSSASQPMFMRTRAIPLGGWNMSSQFDREYTLPSDIQPNRVSLVSTTIQSDPTGCGPGCLPGSKFTNFHRPLSNSGTNGSGDRYALGGGVTYLNGSRIRLVMGKDLSSPDDINYYESGHSLLTSGGSTYNRGYIRLDYLAAECADGTGQLTRGIIGSFPATTDDCHGQYGANNSTSTNYVIQTRGPTIATSTDAFYYAYKSLPNGTQYHVTAKVMELENSGTSAKAGVMLRLNTTNTSYHATVVVTGNSVQFIRKAINGADVTTVSNITAPVWVRVVKSYDTYRGYYSTNGATWTRIGPDANITTAGPFLAGLASSGNGLTTSGYTGVTFSNTAP